MTQNVGGPPDWYYRRAAIDPNHPDVEWYNEQQRALREYQERMAASRDPAARLEAARAYKRTKRANYWRRVRRRTLYSPPHLQGPRKQHQPGRVEQTCSTCDRVDDRIEFWTCGCFGTSCMMTLVPIMSVDATPRPRAKPTVPARAGLAAIRAYQRGISAHLPAVCRYTPSCSEYGAQAVRKYGLGAGSRLTAARIRRCTPDVPRGTPDELV